MSKTFPQKSSEAFLNLKKSALRRTKKLHQIVLTRAVESESESRSRSRKDFQPEELESES